MIVANSGAALMYLLGSNFVRQSLPNMPNWTIPILMLLLVFNLACAIALFQWKKWGFWGFCVSGFVSILVNLSIGLGIGTSLGGLIGIAILYGVLQIGSDNKGWQQLD